MPIVLDADAWQREVIDHPARIKIVMGGRGVGKTVGCARNMLIKAALSTPHGEYAYFSPSYAIAKRECRAIARHRIMNTFVEDTGDQPFPFIDWRSGAKTYFRSLDREDNVLGYHLDGAIIDEVHKNGERAVDEIVRPQIGAKRGWLLLIGQHDEDGEEGWIHKRFFTPEKNDGVKVKAWRIPSSMGRMYQGEEGRAELEFIRSTTNDYEWRWQYMAEAVESQNKAFRSADIALALRSDLNTKDRASSGKSYIGGYDIGKVVDPSAETILEAVDRDRCNVVHAMLHPLGVRHEMQAQGVARLSRVFGGCTIIVDATGTKGASGGAEGDSYSKFYATACNEVRPFVLNQHTKMRLMQDLQLGIEQNRIGIPAKGCEELVKQLQIFRWESKSAGILSFSGPDGHRDDLVISLAMAYGGFLKGLCGSGSVRSLAGVL
jgi:hypothetical protein